MLRRGSEYRDDPNEPIDDPPAQQPEEGRSAATNWQPQGDQPAFYDPGSPNSARDDTPAGASPTLPEETDAPGASDSAPQETRTAASPPAQAQDTSYAAGDAGAANDEEQEWYDDDQGYDDQEYDDQGYDDDEERALALYEQPQPPVRQGFISTALLVLSGQRREIANLQARVTGPMIVPGSGKVALPGAFGHTPFSPRAQRPRPFLMLVFIIILALITITSTAWAAAPLDTQVQVFNDFGSIAGLAAPAATTTPQYNWYVVHYGDTLQSIASKFGVSPNGILLMNGLEDADQLYVGLSLKIPTDPTYGANADVGVVDIPPPPPDKSGNVFGTNPWNSLSGPTDPNGICAPVGNSDTEADRQAFQLGAPNPHASFARGFTWYHNGVDLDNPPGTPILAAQAGLVVFAGWDTLGLGWSVKINHCNGLSTVYGHMEHPPLVKTGGYVSAGQQIGLEGSTGDSTGPHLHFMTEWWNKAANPYCFDFVLPAGNTPCTSS